MALQFPLKHNRDCFEEPFGCTDRRNGRHEQALCTRNKKKKGKKVDERKKGITEKENGDSLRRKRL